MKSTAAVVIICCMILAARFHAQSQTLGIVTEEFPPYNYTQNGALKGLSTEVVQAVLDELDETAQTEVLPWARALKTAERNPNVLIYSIGRIPARELLFKWVGVIAPAEFYLFGLKQRPDIRIDALEDAKQYTIATVNQDVREQYLTSKGFVKGKQLRPTRRYAQGFEKMRLGRIDLWAMNELVAYWIVRQAGHDPEEALSKTFHLAELSSEGYYMAFGNRTSDTLVKRFRTALEAIKRNGTYARIHARYLKPEVGSRKSEIGNR